jgi:hypothetical protein
MVPTYLKFYGRHDVRKVYAEKHKREGPLVAKMLWYAFVSEARAKYHG